MAFDRRGYYYRSVRDGNRVRRVYLGRGPAADLAELLAAERRAGAAETSRHWHEADAARAPAEASLQTLDEVTDLMMRATLLAAGYHRHDRGPWRRRRMSNLSDDNTKNRVLKAPQLGGNERSAAPAMADQIQSLTTPPGSGELALTEAELRALTGRAERGDQTVLPALRALLDARPALWRHCGNLARVAEADWVDLIAGRNLLTRESAHRSLTALKADMAGADCSPLERLLAERVACCWLQVNHADIAVARLRGQNATIAQLDLMQRRQERTQRSFLAAIQALATVRRLGVTAPTEAVAADEKKAGRGRKQHGRSGGVASETTRPGAEPVAHTEAVEDQAAEREVVPPILRDRLKGLVGSDGSVDGVIVPGPSWPSPSQPA